MALLGAGVGFTMQIMVLAVQNEAPAEDLGVATSTVTFFRSVGGSLGVALFGALFSGRLTDLLGSGAVESMTPSQISQLAPGERAQMAGAYADAITGVFLVAVPVLLLGFALTWFLREVPLRTSTSRAGDDAGPAPLDAAATDELAPQGPAPVDVTGTVVEAALAAAGPGTIDAGPGLASPAHRRRSGYNSRHRAAGQREAAGQSAGR